MASLSATNVLALETSDPGRRKGLGSRLSSWQKKSTRVNLSVQFAITGGTNAVESAESTLSTTDDTAPVAIHRVVIHDSGEKWAKVWMRKLRRKKKHRNSEIPGPQPRVLTLAEQLRKAQAEELCLEDCQVLTQPNFNLNIDASHL
jgi:hypothetical protein